MKKQKGAKLKVEVVKNVKDIPKEIPDWNFLVLFASNVSATERLALFDRGVKMVTDQEDVLEEAKRLIGTMVSGDLECPYCGVFLDEDSLWHHMPMFHMGCPNISVPCPVCRDHSGPVMPHFRNAHGPCGNGRIIPEDKSPGKLYAFCLVVVRHPHTGHYLLVQEFSAAGFWLPGGRMEKMERFDETAIRETKEEAGVDIELRGVLQVQYSPNPHYSRMRVIYYGEPRDVKQPPKSMPDFESCGAAWVPAQEVLGGKLRLRGSEPFYWISYLEEKKGVIHPLSILSSHEN